MTQIATTAVSNWNFHKYHVQSVIKGGEFISAETTLVAAGPANLSSAKDATGDFVFPIGVLENVGISQSKQLQRIFEIGSTRSYFIPGRVVGSVSIGRVMYYGPSLLKALYALMPYSDSSKMGIKISDKSLIADATLFTSPDFKLNVAPGYGDIMLNLGSDMFNQPFGLAVYFRNQVNTTTSAIYLEECYVQGHQLSISSGSALLMEGASLQYDILTPINLTDKTYA